MQKINISFLERKFRFLGKTYFSTCNRVRGMYDWFPSQMKRFNFVRDQAKHVSSLYGYQEISTPILEHVGVFDRSLGLGSDVVMKEMYQLNDLAGNELVLRPENTAGIVRAFLEEKIASKEGGLNEGIRYFYCGPMFRYEKPHKGRARQFHQIGCELLGANAHYLSDVEMISMAVNLFSALNISNKIRLQLNTLGDDESRSNYKHVLTDYFNANKLKLSSESIKRIERGSVLRILDSKEKSDQELINKAPKITEYLNKSSASRFEEVCKALSSLGIKYEINTTLVRGLDYYTHSIFEFVAHSSELGASTQTVLAGGRYDGLAKLLGSKEDIHGVGWAAGIERLIGILSEEIYPKEKYPISIIAVRNKQEHVISLFTQKIAHDLRTHNIPVAIVFEGNTSKQIKKLSKESIGAIFIGEDELKSGKATFKNLLTGSQQSIALDIHHLVPFCKQFMKENENRTIIDVPDLNK